MSKWTAQPPSYAWYMTFEKKKSCPVSPPTPPKHGVTKRSSFHRGERKRCTNRKPERASSEDTGGISKRQRGWGVPARAPCRGVSEKIEEESEWSASFRSRANRQETCKIWCTEKGQPYTILYTGLGKDLIRRQRDGFFQVSFIWPLAHCSPT